jgi:regulator of nucleoside diphosphate kinase
LSRQIYITENDYHKLNDLLNEALIEGVQGDVSFKILEAELKNAKIVDSKMLPRNVVTMNSRILIDLN